MHSRKGKSAWNESRWALCLSFGSVKFVPALHSSGYEIDGVMTYMGEASGIILEAEDKKFITLVIRRCFQICAFCKRQIH